MNKSSTRSERSQSSAASLTQWICKPVYWAKFNPNDPNEVRRIANWSVEGSGLYCGNLKEDQARLIAAAPLLLEACVNYDGAVIEVINAVNDGDLGLIIKATNKLRNEVVKSRTAINAAQEKE